MSDNQQKIFSLFEIVCSQIQGFRHQSVIFLSHLEDFSIENTSSAFDLYTREFNVHHNRARNSYNQLRANVSLPQDIATNSEFQLSGMSGFYSTLKQSFFAQQQYLQMKTGQFSLIEKYVLSESFLVSIYRELMNMQMALIAAMSSQKSYVRSVNRYLKTMNLPNLPKYKDID